MDSRMVASTDNQGSVRRASGIDRCWVGGRRIRHQSTQKKHGDVVIDLDAWVRAIPASLCALLVAGERAPIRSERSQKFIAAHAAQRLEGASTGFYFLNLSVQVRAGR